MRNIRTYADIEAERAAGGLTPAEEKLIECCKEGWICKLGDGTRPNAPSDTRTVGADLLRYLITGGCEGCKVHDLGIQLAGAYVPDLLNLDYAQAKGNTALVHCHFEHAIFAYYCHFNALNLEGSALKQGLSAQGAVVVGSVFLRNGFSAKGCIDLNSTKIEGSLTCNGGQIEATDGLALNTQGLQIKGSVFLSEGFSAKGCVDLNSTLIGGQLDCHGGKIEAKKDHALNAQHAQVTGSVFLSKGFTAKGRVTLLGAKIGGQLTCVKGTFHAEGGIALNLQDTRAAGFFWKDVTEISGMLNLNGAHFGTITDDPESWGKVTDLSLVGLTYTHINNPGDTGKRLEWLGKGHAMNGEFSPQPYTQLAKVLREMGHDHGARQILFEKEKRLANAEKQRSLDRIAKLKDAQSAPEFHQHSQQTQQNGQVELAKLREEQCFSTLWSSLLRRSVGYGYKPRLILYWTGGIILAMTILSSLTYNLGGIVPNSAVVLLSDEWADAVEQFNPAEAWVSTKAGEHYETFSPLAYAADVFIPLVPLGQETAWAPTTATRLGCVLWALNWLVKLSGWFISALGAAAIAGVIRRE